MSEEIPSTPLEPPLTVPAQPLTPARPIVPPGVVPWNKDLFLSRYPQFEDRLTDAQLEQAWELACLIQRNDAQSVIPFDPQKRIFTRRSILYLLMCHLCTLALRPYDQAGAVQSAGEGSVNASFAVPSRPDSTYFCQTPCGATYWQLIKQFAYGGHYFNVRNYHPWG